MHHTQISFERGSEFRDYVEAREPFFLRELAGWMDATGGPLQRMDSTAESLVELWPWFIGFVDAGAPGVPGRPWRYAVPSRCVESSQRGASASKWLVRNTD